MFTHRKSLTACIKSELYCIVSITLLDLLSKLDVLQPLIMAKFIVYNVYDYISFFNVFRSKSSKTLRAVDPQCDLFTQARNQGGGAFARPKFSKHCIAILTFAETFKE